ncbi:hypothetical protein Tco_0072379 [Tanacetum coccineum]
MISTPMFTVVGLNSLWREFDALTNLPTCTCDANKELDLHNKLMKLMQFLMGLDDCYQSIKSSLLTRDPLPEVKDAYTIVFKEESHRGIPKYSNVIGSKLSATSFTAKSFNVNKRGNNANNSSGSTYFNNNRGLVTDIQETDKNKAKNDKTEHENRKSVKKTKSTLGYGIGKGMEKQTRNHIMKK